jgi:hypothetical protein
MADQKYLDEIPMQCHAKSKVFYTKLPCNVMLDQKYLDEIYVQYHAKSKAFG